MYHRVNLDMLQPIKKWCSYTLVNQGEDDKRNVFGLCSLPPTLKNLTLIPDQNLRTDVTVTTHLCKWKQTRRWFSEMHRQLHVWLTVHSYSYTMQSKCETSASGSLCIKEAQAAPGPIVQETFVLASWSGSKRCVHACTCIVWLFLPTHTHHQALI